MIVSCEPLGELLGPADGDKSDSVVLLLIEVDLDIAELTDIDNHDEWENDHGGVCELVGGDSVNDDVALFNCGLVVRVVEIVARSMDDVSVNCNVRDTAVGVNV